MEEARGAKGESRGPAMTAAQCRGGKPVNTGRRRTTSITWPDYFHVSVADFFPVGDWMLWDRTGVLWATT